jgi:hypothetical protein
MAKRDLFIPIMGAGRGGGREKARTITVTNREGVAPWAGRGFTFEVVRKGERYGRQRQAIHEQAEPLIVCYDATYAGHPGHEELGQLTGGKYYLTTLLEREAGVGLDVHGGVPEWTVEAEAMDVVGQWLATL